MKALLIFLVLMLIGCGVLVYHVRKQNREARYEAFVLQGHRTTVETNHEAIVQTVAACQRMLENAERLLPVVSNLLAETLKIEAQAIPGQEVVKEARVAGALAAPQPPTGGDGERPVGIMGREEIDRRRQLELTGGRADGRAADVPSAVVPAPTVPERPRAAPVEEEGKPEGIMGRKELDAMRARANKEALEPSAPKPVVRPEPVPVLPPPPKPVAPAARPVVKREERPIQILARQVEGHVGRVREVAQSAMAVEGDAHGLLGEVMSARISTTAAEKVAAIVPLATTVTVFQAECAVELELARNGIQPMELERKKAQNDYEVKVEDARRRKEEADRNALTAREVSAAVDVAKELAGMIRQFQFAEACARATLEMEQCKTDEGKAAHSVLVDRCGRLKEIKAYVVKRLNDKPYRWGWGEQANARDILSADEQGVKHATGKASWPEIGIKQLAKIVNYALSDTSPGVKVMGDCYLGAAILFKDLGAAELAEGYRSKAVFTTPYLENEAIRLLR